LFRSSSARKFFEFREAPRSRLSSPPRGKDEGLRSLGRGARL